MSSWKTRWLAGLLSVVMWALWIQSPLMGQQEEESEEPKPAAEQSEAAAEKSEADESEAEQSEADESESDKTTRKKPRGRLPNYFAAVVTPTQREEVYTIQAQYEEQIAELRMQIEKLLSQRDKEVDAVLTPEQMATVAKKREEAAERRKSRSVSGSGADS